MQYRVILFAMVVSLLGTAMASAALVTNISTGIDRITGQKLANNAPDSDWVIAPGDGLETGEIPVARSTPVPSIFVPDSASTASRWIAVNTGLGLEGISVPTTGIFYYQTTVNLNGFDALTAAINGQLAVDDTVKSIELNGVTIFTPAGGTLGTQSKFTALPTDLGLGLFKPGVNTITFDVDNVVPGTPESLRLEAGVTATPNVSSVPTPAALPASLIVLTAGSLGLLARGRWKKSGV